MSLARYTITEPGSVLAQAAGCTCPTGQTSAPYRRDEGCPLHTLPFSHSSEAEFRGAQVFGDRRDQGRAA